IGRFSAASGPSRAIERAVDNPKSSCLSCHSTAEWKSLSDTLPDSSDPMKCFRNIKATTAFDSGQRSLGYSLQLVVGIEQFSAAHPASPIAAAVTTANPAKKPMSRGEDDDN